MARRRRGRRGRKSSFHPQVLQGGKVTATGMAAKPTLVAVNICRHYDVRFNLNEFIHVWPSSLLNERTSDEAPDFGLYADWTWKPWWRNEHIDWADFGLPWDLGIAYEQIQDALTRASMGQKVEVGCLGGHGRTGTILASMCVMVGQDAHSAIHQVRRGYCGNAVETDEQEWFVHYVEARLNKVEPPPQNFTPFIYSDKWGMSKEQKKEIVQRALSSTPKLVSPCGPEEHYEMWVKGGTHCLNVPGNCRYFDDDVTQFVAGYVPESVLLEEYERNQDGM